MKLGTRWIGYGQHPYHRREKGMGSEAVKQALAEGHRVRAFARSIYSVGLDHTNLEKRKGDALHEQDVTSALQGMNLSFSRSESLSD